MTTRLTYLGHAGFCLETPEVVVVMDPWLSSHGAFDAAWFQFPRNHHLAPVVREKLSDPSKARFIYVSHEHNDHFDPAFLRSLPNSEITYVIPHFQRDALRSIIAGFQPKAMITCAHNQSVPIPGGYVKLFLDDSGLNRDSGILLKIGDHCLLNLNDCKLYEQLPAIVRENGPISVFTCQFSGATWHPTCYNYTPEEYERISEQKAMSKFEMIARAIESAGADVYLPSAGPACFLDPALMHLNFERVNIFPRASKFLNFLDTRLSNSRTKHLDIAPGDVLEVPSNQLIASGAERVDDHTLRDYLDSYAGEYRGFFEDLYGDPSQKDLDSLFDRLRVEIDRKLSHFTLHHRVRVPLYFGLTDAPATMLRIDFLNKTTQIVGQMADSDFYSISAPSWQVARILDGEITWEEFALTFRMRLNRRPDVYQTLIQGFLLMEPEDMNWFCAQLLEIEDRQKRVIVEAGGIRYSIDRFCPHQGADLSQGWLNEGNLWTCPRHRWQFSLDHGGRCLTSDAGIHAVCLEND